MLFLTIRLYARYERIKERHESTKDERERERERECELREKRKKRERNGLSATTVVRPIAR